MTDNDDEDVEMPTSWDMMISLSNPSEGRTLIAMDEDQFDEMTASVWNTAWTILWASMQAIFVPEEFDNDDWSKLAVEASIKAKKAMMRGVMEEMDEDYVMKSAIRTVCNVILKSLRKGSEV